MNNTFLQQLHLILSSSYNQISQFEGVSTVHYLTMDDIKVVLYHHQINLEY